MDSVDRLLAELKAKNQQQTQSELPLEQHSADQTAGSAQGSAPSSNHQSLDQLLDQLEEGTKRTVRAQLLSSPPVTHADTTPIAAEIPLADEITRSPENSLLSHLKSHYDAQDQAEAKRQQQEQRQAEQQRQQQEREKQRRLEALRKQRRAELAEQAKQWLAKISPKSEEGLWFEEFACNYDSRLEAAIDYLEALQTVERESRK
jgi:hypothetical protein